MTDDPLEPPSPEWPDGKPAWAGSAVCGHRLGAAGRWLVVQRLWPDRGRVTVCDADIAVVEAY